MTGKEEKNSKKRAGDRRRFLWIFSRRPPEREERGKKDYKKVVNRHLSPVAEERREGSLLEKMSETFPRAASKGGGRKKKPDRGRGRERGEGRESAINCDLSAMSGKKGGRGREIPEGNRE